VSLRKKAVTIGYKTRLSVLHDCDPELGGGGVCQWVEVAYNSGNIVDNLFAIIEPEIHRTSTNVKTTKYITTRTRGYIRAVSQCST